MFGCIYPDMCIAYSFACISPDMCIAYTLVLSSIQVIQGFIHDGHKDLINKLKNKKHIAACSLPVVFMDDKFEQYFQIVYFDVRLLCIALTPAQT